MNNMDANIEQIPPAREKKSPQLSDSEFALTKNQSLMWLGQKLTPTIPLYNMVHIYKLNGTIEPDKFQQAFRAVVDRSDALRTVINEVDGLPQQKFTSRFAGHTEILDFSTQSDPQAYFQDWLKNRSVRQFDLTERLVDSVLLKISNDEFIWYLNQHHLISDAESARLVYEYTAQFYDLALKGQLDQAPDLPAFQNYIDHERTFHGTELYNKAAGYWQERLAQPFEPISFYDQPASGATWRTRRVSCELGPERSQRLRSIVLSDEIGSISADLALFSTFSALLLSYLYRISGNQSLRIGTPFHNRSSADFKKTIGLFIEIGSIQAEIEENETFLSLIKKVIRDSLNGFMNARPGTSSAVSNKGYSVLLNYLKSSYTEFNGIPMEREWIHTGFGDKNHSLRLQVHDFNNTGSFVLHFDLNEDQFDEEKQGWVVQHFLKIVDEFLTNPNLPIGQINLLSEVEEQRLIVDFNQTHAPYPADKTVTQLFESQAMQTPEAVALKFGQQELTYVQLNRQANQLAHYLKGQGVGPGVLVGLCIERSPEAIIGMLGVLKAGGGYVPLDASLPQQRLAFMLNETQSPVVLTTQRLAAKFSQSRVKIVSFDSDWSIIEAESDENPVPVAGDEDLAYVIYTSGSTGTPKGAMVRHSNLLNYVWWAKNFYLRGQKLAFPLFSSLSFDLTVTSIYVPLVSGGSIVIYGEGEMDNLVVLDVIKDNLVDIIKLTPAHLSLVREINPAQTRLRKMIVGGEDFKRSLAKNITDMFGDQLEIYNEYGPTEATVGCMIHRFAPDTDLAVSVPIGRPISNSQVYILDEHLNPVPPGVIGEMCISGAGVAQGYLNQPDLTASKFISNPLQPGATMYRTGDLARWTSDGQMQFLGRADHQVKVKGHRVELGEIESTLLSHPDIEAAVVTLVESSTASSHGVGKQCVKCGLPDNYPDANLDEQQGICNTCREFDTLRERFQPYFKSQADLQLILDRAKESKTGKYDCMVLYSGGKDSTYMLYQLVREKGMTPLVFSLENGYISTEAKENIRRVTDDLGVDLVFGQTPHMNAVFVDSLKRHSNVCNGCFKVIYTLSINLARQKGIKYIFTGLSRGQLFETRLSDMFQARIFDVDEIDRTVLAARKAYHRIDDAVTQLLDVEIFNNDNIFDEIQLVDFYRYTDVPLHEMYRYLDQHALWVRPSDTGRSTNCLINDVGIYIHKKERGFHNYALPYSWDVRVGHKTRREAIDELDDEIDTGRVRQILTEIGYDEEEKTKQPVAYFVPTKELSIPELTDYLRQHLPDYMLPAHFMPLEKLPLTQNGKVDRQALPRPEASRNRVDAAYVAAESAVELKLVEVWSQLLNIPQVGIHDNFFDLGGDSIMTIQAMMQISQIFQIELQPVVLFERPTIAELADHIEDILTAEIENLTDEEAELLLASLD